MHLELFDRLRYDVLAKVLEGVVEAVLQRAAVKEVDSHGGLVPLGISRQTKLRQKWGRDAQAVEQAGIGRLFDKMGDAAIDVSLHDAESFSRLALYRQGRDGQLCLGGEMTFHQLAVIHLVKLITAKNEEIFPGFLEEVFQILPHRIGRPLVPTGTRRSLLCRENLHKTSRAENVEFVSSANVLMQGSRVELGQDVNVANSCV